MSDTSIRKIGRDRQEKRRKNEWKETVQREEREKEKGGEANRGAWGAARKGLRSKPSVALSRQLGGDS